MLDVSTPLLVNVPLLILRVALMFSATTTLLSIVIPVSVVMVLELGPPMLIVAVLLPAVLVKIS